MGFLPGFGVASWAYRGHRLYWTTGALRRYGGGFARSCRSNSLSTGTAVVMADGTSKPIEHVELGELVLAADPETGEVAPEPVTDLIAGSGIKDLVVIKAEADGTVKHRQ